MPAPRGGCRHLRPFPSLRLSPARVFYLSFFGLNPGATEDFRRHQMDVCVFPLTLIGRIYKREGGLRLAVSQARQSRQVDQADLNRTPIFRTVKW